MNYRKENTKDRNLELSTFLIRARSKRRDQDFFMHPMMVELIKLMNKILKQSFSISRRYLINREAVSLKEIEFCSTPLNLNDDCVSPIDLIVKISQQIDP